MIEVHQLAREADDLVFQQLENTAQIFFARNDGAVDNRLFDLFDRAGRPRIRESWPRESTLLATAMGALAVLMSLRGVTNDPTGSWWSIGILVLMSSLGAALNWQTLQRAYLYTAGLLFSLAVSIWWISPGAVNDPQATHISMSRARTALEGSFKTDPFSVETPGEIVSDLKTSDKSPASHMAAQSQQLTFYAMLRRAVTGILPKGEMLRYVVRTPKKHDLKVVELTTVVTTADVDALVHRLSAATEAIQKGVFVPAAPSHWRCSLKYCEYAPTCKFFIGRK
jgi:hypothetical protein